MKNQRKARKSKEKQRKAMKRRICMLSGNARKSKDKQAKAKKSKEKQRKATKGKETQSMRAFRKCKGNKNKNKEKQAQARNIKGDLSGVSRVCTVRICYGSRRFGQICVEPHGFVRISKGL